MKGRECGGNNLGKGVVRRLPCRILDQIHTWARFDGQLILSGICPSVAGVPSDRGDNNCTLRFNTLCLPLAIQRSGNRVEHEARYFEAERARSAKLDSRVARSHSSRGLGDPVHSPSEHRTVPIPIWKMI